MPEHPLVVDIWKQRPQYVVKTPATKAAPYMGDLNDLLVQFHAVPARPDRPVVGGGRCHGRSPPVGTREARKNGDRSPCAQPPRAWPAGLALCPENAPERLHVQVRIDQQPLELGVP